VASKILSLSSFLSLSLNDFRTKEMIFPCMRIVVLVVMVVGAQWGCSQSDLGQGGSVVQGAAGPAGVTKPSAELVQCAAPITSVALNESPNGYAVLSSYQLPPSPLPLIRLIMQQSGCFRVLDRALGLRATVQEQELKSPVSYTHLRAHETM
jgi:hypothetical protein